MKKKVGRPHINYKKNSINTEIGNKKEDDLIQQTRNAVRKIRKNILLHPRIEYYIKED